MLLLACGEPAPTRGMHPSGELAGAPANVVWIVVDGLRADHADSPAMQRLAGDGQRFENLFAHSPSTLPATTSLFSSRRPLETGVLTDGRRIEAGVPLLAEWLAEHGYRTAAAVGLAELWPLEPGTGLDRGFERFEHPPRELADASDVLSIALDQLAALLDQLAALDGTGAQAPFLLYVHFADPHRPYRAHGTADETAEVYLDGQAELSIPILEDGWWEDRIRLPRGDHVIAIKSILPLEVRRLRATLELESGEHFPFEAEPGANELIVHNAGPDEGVFHVELWAQDLPDPATAAARYRLEVEHADRAVGALLDELRRRGLYDRALVLLTSNHGQALGERGRFGHDLGLYDELLRVPWLLKLPAEHPQAGALERARKKLVRQIDVTPTVLALLGLPGLPGQVGTSVLEGTLRVPLAEFHPPHGVGDQFSLRDESLKLLLHADEERFEMFDLIQDPGETLDVFGTRGAEKADWRQALLGAARRFRELEGGR